MYTLLTTGDWTADQVHVGWTADSRPRDAKVERLINDTWSAAIARQGVHLFDGPMCRLESWNASGQCLELVLSHTSYKVFFGTNLTHPELADQFGRGLLANPVGLSAALVTSDNFLMLGRRNASVAYYPNRIHPFAGALEPDDGMDLFKAMRRELHEEIGLPDAEISQMRCRGIVEDNALRQPEIIFEIETARTRADVESNIHSAEHHAAWAIPVTPADLEKALQNLELTPVAVATLRLLGNSRFGDEWPPPPAMGTRLQ